MLAGSRKIDGRREYVMLGDGHYLCYMNIWNVQNL